MSGFSSIVDVDKYTLTYDWLKTSFGSAQLAADKAECISSCVKTACSKSDGAPPLEVELQLRNAMYQGTRENTECAVKSIGASSATRYLDQGLHTMQVVSVDPAKARAIFHTDKVLHLPNGDWLISDSCQVSANH